MVSVPASVHDPQRIIANFGPVPLIGLAPGRFVTVRRDVQTWQTIEGTNGEFKRRKARRRSGTFEFVFRGSAPINRLLSVLLQVDENTGGVFQSISVADSLNGGLFSGTNAYIQNYPEKIYSGKEVDTIWTFRCEDLKMTFPGTSLESLGIRLFDNQILS
jgi:hypothetical protein